MPPSNINNTQDMGNDQPVPIKKVSQRRVSASRNPQQVTTQQPPETDEEKKQRVEQLLVDYKGKITTFHKIMMHMLGHKGVPILLAGETGIGKTTMVQELASILGFDTVVIEVPQVVEEQLINIPFLVKNEYGQQERGGSINVTKTGKDPLDDNDQQLFGIKLARSDLHTRLSQLRKIPDEQYEAYIKTLPKNTQDFILAFNVQTETENEPSIIKQVRAKYENILFLDEFLRTTKPAIRNILRGILNGKIGMDPLPPSTYVIYASNIFDSGVDRPQVPGQVSHETHKRISIPAPTVQQWLDFVANKKGVNWHPDVLDSFQKNLTNQALSYTHATGQDFVRTSPRRWDEIILAINNFYPFQSLETVNGLYGLLKRQFQDEEKNESPVFEVVQKIISDLAQRCNIDPTMIQPMSSKEWQKALAMQLNIMMNSGKLKKYVPVLQGLPGTAKTSVAKQVAKENNLIFVSVECPTIEADSVMGIPNFAKKQLSNNDSNKESNDYTTDDIIVKFTEPELYMRIVRDIKRAEEDYKKELIKQGGGGVKGHKFMLQKFKEFENQRYKYLILFDEINRVKSVNVFNSLRRLILEKEFNDAYKLPEKSLIIGAMNPTDSLSIAMTGHFRDAIDIIEVEPDWDKFIEYLKIEAEKLRTEGKDPKSIKAAFSIIKGFPDAIYTPVVGEEFNEFFIQVGPQASDKIYVNMRSYENIFSLIQITLAHIATQSSFKEMTIEAKTETMVDRVYDEFIEAFDDIADKAVVPIRDTFEDTVKKYLSPIIRKMLGEQSYASTGLSVILSQFHARFVKDGAEKAAIYLTKDPHFNNYMNSFDESTFSNDFYKYLTNTKDVNDYNIILDEMETIRDVIEKKNYATESFGGMYDAGKQYLWANAEKWFGEEFNETTARAISEMVQKLRTVQRGEGTKSQGISEMVQKLRKVRKG